MRVRQLQNKTSLEALTLTERDDLHPGPEQVLIQMHAAALNYRDALVINGLYNPNLPLPFVPLSDGVGSIVAVGQNVTRVKPGDPVADIFAQNWLSGEMPEGILTLGADMVGVLAQRVVLHQDGVEEAL